MYDVTIATLEEVPVITRLCKNFEQASKLVTVDIDHSVKAYTQFITSGIGAMLLLKRDGDIIGGLGCLKYPDLHSGVLIAVETFWFVLPEHRGRGLMLLDAFEAWGASQGCKKLAMIHLTDSYPAALERLYRMRGYQLVEKHYIKEVQP